MSALQPRLFRMRRMRPGTGIKSSGYTRQVGRWHYVTVPADYANLQTRKAKAVLSCSHGLAPGQPWGGPQVTERISIDEWPKDPFRLGSFLGLDVFTHGL